MIKISAEIPHALYSDLYPLHDLHFLLAQEILEGRIPQIGAGECVLVDNGLHEREEPLGIHDVLKAAECVGARSAIAPDWLWDRTQTQRASEEMLQVNKVCFTGTVIQGTSLAEMVEYFQYAIHRSYYPICFPYRVNRLALLHLIPRNWFAPHNWYHLLGVRSLREINLIAQMNLPGEWSLDTGKHIKLGLYQKKWDFMGEEARGQGLLDLNIALDYSWKMAKEMEAIPRELEYIYYNTARLRRAACGTY